MMFRATILLTIGFALATVSARAAGELTVVYPQNESSRDQRASYPLQVLRDCLERSGVPFTLQPSADPMQQARSLRELAAGKNVSVVWSVASRERDAQLRRIRFPIDRGLIGWRELFVRQGDTRFESVHSVEDLAQYTAGQGHDWPDVAVLRENGLRVAESPTYEGLFAMLGRGHIDYFPRGINEIRKELAGHADANIALEQRLLLIYPEALYFYVNRADDALAEAIERGLQRGLADGSFMARFETTYRRTIDELVDHRRVLRLHNDNRPDDSDTEHPELWLTIGQ